MRRPLLLLGLLGGLALIGWFGLNPGDLRLDLHPASREVILIFPDEARGRRTAEVVLHAAAELTEPDHRLGLRRSLQGIPAGSADRAAIGFIPGKAPDFRPRVAEIRDGGRSLPGRALVQLAGVPNGYLILHAEPVAPMLETARRRRWLAGGLVAAGASAEAATLVVGEGDDQAFLVATIAFAYRTGEEAEAALNLLLTKQGDYEALGFAARPGTGRITRQTKLLVVRFDIEADLVLQALRGR